MKIIFHPGSVSHPLEKAPSGHLLLVIDDYARCAVASPGGVADEPTHLLTHNPSTSSASAPVHSQASACERPGPVSAESAVGREEQQPAEVPSSAPASESRVYVRTADPVEDRTEEVLTSACATVRRLDM